MPNQFEVHACGCKCSDGRVDQRCAVLRKEPLDPARSHAAGCGCIDVVGGPDKRCTKLRNDIQAATHTSPRPKTMEPTPPKKKPQHIGWGTGGSTPPLTPPRL